MQKMQMESFIESDRQNEEFLVRLEEHQQKAAKEDRERDREFFMLLAALLTKK